jgi:hypothetical protein
MPLAVPLKAIIGLWVLIMEVDRVSELCKRLDGSACRSTRQTGSGLLPAATGYVPATGSASKHKQVEGMPLQAAD